MKLCPPLSKALVNTYRSDIDLFTSGETLSSQEGTTQGDPLAMVMYAIATVPLIERISNDDVRQSWYTDDAAAGGILFGLRRWWDDLAKIGPDYGYFPNANKTRLLVKDHLVAEATELFKDTGIHVCTEGTHYLGAAIGKANLLCETKLMHGCVKLKLCKRLLWTNLKLLMQPSLMESGADGTT